MRQKQLTLETSFQLWLNSSLGRIWVDAHGKHLAKLLPGFSGQQVLMLGQSKFLPNLTHCNIKDRFILQTAAARQSGAASEKLAASNLAVIHLVSSYEVLPVVSDSIDLVYLPYILDFSLDPHAVLREVHRVLAPEGQVLITGFSYFSLWGLWSGIAKYSKKAPWAGNFFSITKLKDWLKLLDFAEITHRSFFYRPPFKISKKLEILDKFGKFMHLPFASGYSVLATKSVFVMTPIKPNWIATADNKGMGALVR